MYEILAIVLEAFFAEVAKALTAHANTPKKQVEAQSDPSITERVEDAIDEYDIAHRAAD